MVRAYHMSSRTKNFTYGYGYWRIIYTRLKIKSIGKGACI